MSILRSAARGAALAAATAVLAAGAVLTTTATAAAAPAPMFVRIGGDVLPVPNGACHGTVGVEFELVPNHRDQVEVILTSKGTYGAIPGCDVPVNITITNGIAPFTHIIPATIAGGRTSTIVTAGQGISLIGVTGGSFVGAPAFGTSGYLWLQP